MWANFRVLILASILPVLTSSALSEVPLAAARQAPALSLVRPAISEGFSGPALVEIRGDGQSKDFNALRVAIAVSLDATYREFEKRLGRMPSIAASIRLADNRTFSRLTGAPGWSAAVYFRKEIVIRLDSDTRRNPSSLDHPVRHEYTHAIISALSGGNCPGWLDEGLAQWAERAGEDAGAPGSKRHLMKYLPIRLDLLQGGFTRMSSEMVAPSYAHSLFATRQVIASYGFQRIRVFLDKLKKGQSQSSAFEEAFSISEAAFERQLNLTLRR